MGIIRVKITESNNTSSFSFIFEDPKKTMDPTTILEAAAAWLLKEQKELNLRIESVNLLIYPPRPGRKKSKPKIKSGWSITAIFMNPKGNSKIANRQVIHQMSSKEIRELALFLKKELQIGSFEVNHNYGSRISQYWITD